MRNTKAVLRLILLAGLFCLGGCAKTSPIVESDPQNFLSHMPAGYRYEFNHSSESFIYQAPIHEPIYEYKSCDSIVGHEAYQAMEKYMKTYGIETIIISENADVFVFEKPRIMDPNDVEAYVFYTDESLTEDRVVTITSRLFPGGRRVTQSRQLNNNWLRVTPFSNRERDYMGLLDF